jgi:hypothetical protein
MKTFIPQRLRRLFAIPLLLLPALHFTAPLAHAGPPPLADFNSMSMRATMFLAGLMTEVINDRARLIQASVFIVVLGIALLWWRK